MTGSNRTAVMNWWDNVYCIESTAKNKYVPGRTAKSLSTNRENWCEKYEKINGWYDEKGNG